MPEFRTWGDVCSFGNDAVALRWALEDAHLTHCSLVDCTGACELPIAAPFALTFADGNTLGAAGMRVLAPVRKMRSPPTPTHCDWPSASRAGA